MFDGGINERWASVLRDRTTLSVYRYWRSLCRAPLPPSRFDIDPKEMAANLPNVFILECDAPNHYSYRIAGTAMTEVFGRNLRRRSFVEPWNHHERESIETVLTNVVSSRYAGAVTGSAWAGEDRLCPYQMLLLPLRFRGDQVLRILGVFTTPTPPLWAGMWQLLRMTVSDIRVHPWEHLDVPTHPSRNPATSDESLMSSRPSHLHVIDGGKLGVRTRLGEQLTAFSQTRDYVYAIPTSPDVRESSSSADAGT